MDSDGPELVDAPDQRGTGAEVPGTAQERFEQLSSKRSELSAVIGIDTMSFSLWRRLPLGPTVERARTAFRRICEGARRSAEGLHRYATSLSGCRAAAVCAQLIRSEDYTHLASLL